MTTYTSRDNKYTLSQTGNRLTVDYGMPPQVLKTTFNNGETKQEVSTYREVFHADPMPHTIAYVITDRREWDIDTSAGLMRWSGQVSNREFCRAMARLGFASQDYQAAIRLARASDRQEQKDRAARDLAYA